MLLQHSSTRVKRFFLSTSSYSCVPHEANNQCSNEDAGPYLYRVDDGLPDGFFWDRSASAFSYLLPPLCLPPTGPLALWGAQSSHHYVQAKASKEIFSHLGGLIIEEKMGFFSHFFFVLWLLVSSVLKPVTQKLISAILKNVSIPRRLVDGAASHSHFWHLWPKEVWHTAGAYKPRWDSSHNSLFSYLRWSAVLSDMMTSTVMPRCKLNLKWIWHRS